MTPRSYTDFDVVPIPQIESSGDDWPRASIALCAIPPVKNQLVIIMYGKDLMRSWMIEHATWQIDTAVFDRVHVRWRPAHQKPHHVEYIAGHAWNAGKRWPRFSNWLGL